jgi:hypothetical protein
MASEFSQTQQFYTLFNALEAQRVQMTRETSIMSSVLEALPTANRTGLVQKEHFLRQLDALVKEVSQARQKAGENLSDEEKTKALVGAKLTELTEIGRTYNLLVRDMREELGKNEQLNAKINK